MDTQSQEQSDTSDVPVLPKFILPSRWAAYAELVARLKRTLGPWTKHVHGFGCDCGHFQATHPRRGAWHYRASAYDGQVVVYAFEGDDRGKIDESFRADGFFLVDNP